jgi:hypothetical protein
MMISDFEHWLVVVLGLVSSLLKNQELRLRWLHLFPSRSSL